MVSQVMVGGVEKTLLYERVVCLVGRLLNKVYSIRWPFYKFGFTVAYYVPVNY